MIKQDLFIGENTRLLYDIMQITEDKNIPGMLMLCDFEKAFAIGLPPFTVTHLLIFKLTFFCLTQLIFNAAVDKAIHYHHTFLFLVQKCYPLK